MAVEGETEARGGCGLLGVLLVVFVVLKLTDNIDWSWWWVFAPVWGPLVVILLVVCFGTAVMAIRHGFDRD